MSNPTQRPAQDEKKPESAPDQEPGSNAVQHERDPKAEPIPHGEHGYHPRSPYTTGNY